MCLVSPEQGGERVIFILFNPVITFHVSLCTFLDIVQEEGGGDFHEHSPTVKRANRNVPSVVGSTERRLLSITMSVV